MLHIKIESPIPDDNPKIVRELNSILTEALSYTKLDDFVDAFEDRDFRYLVVGFGVSHCWVHEFTEGKAKTNRLLLITE